MSIKRKKAGRPNNWTKPVLTVIETTEATDYWTPEMDDEDDARFAAMCLEHEGFCCLWVHRGPCSCGNQCGVRRVHP